MSSFDIAAGGMAASRAELDVIAANLANADARRPDGTPYRARSVLLESQAPFSAALTSAGDGDMEFASIFDDDAGPAGVRVAGVFERAGEAQFHYDPSHPLAIRTGPKRGFVELSDVDPIAEMVALIGAGRAYDANASALTAAKQMDAQASDIARW